MDEHTFQNIYADALGALMAGRLNDALISTQGLLSDHPDYELEQQIAALRADYAMMLTYWRQGTADPGRNSLYQQFLRRTLEFAFSARHRHLLASSNSYLNLGRPAEADCVFEQILTASLWSQSLYDDTRALLQAEATTHATRLEAASALTLAALSVFDAFKLRLLLDLCTTRDEDLRARSLTGAVLVLYHHRQLLLFYPDIEAQAMLLADDPTLATDLQALQLQLLLSNTTRQDERKLREEIMPDIMKAAQKMRPLRDMDFENMMTLGESEFNPEWDEDGKESRAHQRMHELAEMQLKGTDMFFGTFGQIVRQQDFFTRVKNWFTPFSFDSPIFLHRPATAEAMKQLLRIRPASDTERYALSLVMAQMPQDKMESLSAGFAKMTEQSGELGLPEGSSERASEGENRKERVATKIRFVVQDLYRFFSFFRQRREDTNPFLAGIDLTALPYFDAALHDAKALQAFAEFCFKEKAWEAAADYYLAIPPEERTPTHLEKLGFCCLQLRQDARGAEFLEQALAFKPNSTWTLRQLSRAYARQGDFAQSLATLHELLELQPDDVSTLLRMGQCHISLGEPERAFDPLYKADYLQPDGKALRALAWCSLLTGKLDDATRYYDKILTLQPDASDWQNAGHAAWIAGNTSLAIERYKQSLKTAKQDFATPDFFVNDEALLLENGLTPQDLQMMRDVLNGATEER